MLSVTEVGWFSTGSRGLSFPTAETAPGSVLLDWMWGCKTGPTGCWGASAVAVELWCAGEPVPRRALVAPASAVATDAGVAPEGLGSAVKSCLRTDDGVGLLGCGLYGVGLAG